jgi:hypothetical protein
MAEAYWRGSTGPSTASCRRTRPVRWLLAGSALLAILALGHLLHRWWVSPEHRIARFAGALRGGSMAGLLSLADPVEAQRVGLTPEKLKAMLADAAGAPDGVDADAPYFHPLPAPQSGYNRWGDVTLRTRSGSRLFPVVVQAYNTDAGWKVSVTKFVYAVLVARSGMAYRKERYAALCVRHGVAPEFYWPETGRWETVSTGTASE